ncbi:hypothetical protein ZWY2020_051999 [Hordeum vulgare]|nr:hypothetical protein ZWY2020_051999 [Hordeum vulgare]
MRRVLTPLLASSVRPAAPPADAHTQEGRVIETAGRTGRATVRVDKPYVAKLSTNEWYFFSFRDRKYATGCARTAPPGPATEGHRQGPCHPQPEVVVVLPGRAAIVGMRKTLVFYRGCAPTAARPAGSCTSSASRTLTATQGIVFHKKKADTEYAMDGEQEIVGAWLAAPLSLADPTTSAPRPATIRISTHHSPAAALFPPLGAGGHHYQLTSCDNHHPLAPPASPERR